MKIRFLTILTMVVGFSALSLLFLFANPSEPKIYDGREDLGEVFHSNNLCSKNYRYELDAMIDDQNYDYKNDPIFQECFEFLEFEKYASTAYDPSSVQLEAILVHCIDSKDLVDTKGLSYSNDTHYIDTINCQWQALEMIRK